MSDDVNILIAAVGGQGGLLASRIIAQAALSQNLGVVIGETLGMAQRGGSVVSQVRVGRNALSPVIPRGRGDVVLGFEPIETLRIAFQYLSRDGLVIMNREPVFPIDVRLGLVEYPEIDAVVEQLQRITPQVVTLEATDLAQKAGNAITMNVVMVGALARATQRTLRTDALRAAVEKCVSEKNRKENLDAFDLGYKEAESLFRN